MTGNLQQKNGKYYAVINLYENGKRKQKWIPTNLEVKGNKKKAEQFLRDKIKEFELQENLVHTDILFSEYVLHWLNNAGISVEKTTFKGYEWICNAHIIPYFKTNNTN